MPMPVRTALLAVAAFAAVGWAAVRVTSAADHGATVLERPRHERVVTPRQAAATLAKLAPPPGLRLTRCRFHSPGFAARCFWTPRALALDVASIEQMAAFWQARTGGSLPAVCSRPHRWSAGLVFRDCNWALELGPELVTVTSNSLLAPHGRPRTRAAVEALRYWRRGTELRLTVIGH